MKYDVCLQGLTPLLTHNLDGSFVDSPEKQELDLLNSASPKAKKEPANIARVQQLEWHLGLYLDNDGKPTLPSKVIRAGIHTAAKLSKDGQRVNRGLQIDPKSIAFAYGLEEPNCPPVREMREQKGFFHRAVVTVQRAKILRVRPIFPVWNVVFTVEFDETMINPNALRVWVESAGKFIGFGDWRPDKGGEFGTFLLDAMEEIKDD